ncbi:ATP-binding cassette domain-containing protein [Anaerosporobacter sp.]
MVQVKLQLPSYYINSINKEVLRHKISYISQDSFFFSGTIKENLEFAAEEVTQEMIVEACKKAHIHEFIESLPMKYRTPLEEKATNLSGGQRQRLSIARALIRNPEILIMDEATSNLDSITESAIQHTLDECTKNVTTIIIAHRLSTIKKCQKIYVLDKGSIIESGSHKELLRLKGNYYKLWKEQSIADDDDEIIEKRDGGQ